MQTASLFKRGRGACVIFVEITEGYVIKNGKSMKLSYANSLTFQEGSGGLCHFCGNYGRVRYKKWKIHEVAGEGGGLGCEIPSMVGVRIFSGTTHYTFLIRSLNFVWIACV